MENKIKCNKVKIKTLNYQLLVGRYYKLPNNQIIYTLRTVNYISYRRKNKDEILSIGFCRLINNITNENIPINIPESNIRYYGKELTEEELNHLEVILTAN